LDYKTELCKMTWREAEDAFKKNPVILIPMGSIEQHGPQTPVGDYRYTEELSRLISAKTGAVSIPTIPWGYSEYFKHFPGSLTLRPETLKAVLRDLIDCLAQWNLDHFVMVCGHKGNMPILEQTAREVKEKYQIRMATIEPLSWLTQDFLRSLYHDNSVLTGHGSEPMTSLALYLFPDDARMDLAENGNPGEIFGKAVKGMSTIDMEGFPAYVYCDTEEIAPNGVLGNATQFASKQVGGECMERMVEFGVKFVNWFKELDTCCAAN